MEAKNINDKFNEILASKFPHNLNIVIKPNWLDNFLRRETTYQEDSLWLTTILIGIIIIVSLMFTHNISSFYFIPYLMSNFFTILSVIRLKLANTLKSTIVIHWNPYRSKLDMTKKTGPKTSVIVLDDVLSEIITDYKIMPDKLFKMFEKEEIKRIKKEAKDIKIQDKSPLTKAEHIVQAMYELRMEELNKLKEVNAAALEAHASGKNNY